MKMYIIPDTFKIDLIVWKSTSNTLVNDGYISLK